MTIACSRNQSRADYPKINDVHCNGGEIPSVIYGYMKSSHSHFLDLTQSRVSCVDFYKVLDMMSHDQMFGGYLGYDPDNLSNSHYSDNLTCIKQSFSCKGIDRAWKYSTMNETYFY